MPTPSALVSTRLSIGMTLWLQQDYGADIQRLLVAPNVENREGLCHDV
jgi:hypothetical protein